MFYWGMSDTPWLADALRDAKHTANLQAALGPRRHRPDWDEYALVLAYAATIRSEDLHRAVGACALRHDHSVAGVGYNGALPGRTIDWTDREERLKEAIHAEVNCLAYCHPGECGLIAVTTLPCNDCLKLIARYGIKRVIFGETYERDESSLEKAKRFGIELRQIRLSQGQPQSPACEQSSPAGGVETSQ